MGWVSDNTNKDEMAKKGMRIRMISMEDQNAIDTDLEGTIENVDDLGTLHVKWDDGRMLGVIPGFDKYELLPPSEEQIDIDSFTELFDEASDSKPVLRGSKSTTQGKNVTKNWKSSLSKTRPKVKMKIESEEIKGGEAEGLTIQDIAKKHKVPIGDIRKEIKLGAKIEMEHTDSKAKAKEIAMDHVTEFHDFYSNKKHGAIASEEGLEKDLEETSTAGGVSTGAFIEPLGGKKETIIKKPFAKQVGKEVVGKKSISNPIGKIYTVVKKNESKIINKKDLVSELSSTSATKLRNIEGSFDGDAWVGDKKGWERKDELAWEGGEISDILAKMDIDWNDSDLSLTDKQTDKINEGWLIKTKEDKIVLSILKRVKQHFPEDAKIVSLRYTNWSEGDTVTFSLPGIKQNAKIEVKHKRHSEGGSYGHIQVNGRDLPSSKWAIKKLYYYMFEILSKREEEKNIKNIQADLTDPNFAQDVFDILGDEEINEGKKKKTKESPIHKKKWERCVKDVKKQNKKDGKDYNPYAVCTASIGYKGSIKKPHRKKKEEEIEEATTHASVWGANGPPVVPIFGAKGKDHIPSRKPIFKGGKIIQKVINSGVLTEHTEVEDSPIPGVTSAQFRDELMGVWGLQNVEFIKKGTYSTDSKEEYVLNNEGFINTPKEYRPMVTTLNGKTIMAWKSPSEDVNWNWINRESKNSEPSLFQEVNKIKWVKGGKYVKIKDKCAKYNNQPWCSQGAIDSPLEFSDTVFENIEEVSKSTGLPKEKILDRIKAKLKGVTPEQMEYNKEHGLPIWWAGSKEGFYEKMEPRKNYTGSN